MAIHDNVPPFPEGLSLAPIAEVSHRLLLEQDPDTCAAVLRACQTHGFFYLDLTESEQGIKLLNGAEKAHDLAIEAFQLPMEEKMKYDYRTAKSSTAYKPAGTVKLSDSSQRPDSTEFFNVGKNALFQLEGMEELPASISAAKDILKVFAKGAHDVGMQVISTLSREMGEADHLFTDLNLFDKPSGDHIRLTYKKPSDSQKTDILGLPSHTDFGTITILFNWLGGLQIQSRDSARVGEWEYVKPVPGRAIINLGDAMVHFSNGNLKSAKHRVVPSPGAQAGVDRISIVYFVRPTDTAMMKPVGKFDNGERTRVGGKYFEKDEKIYTAKDWLVRRNMQLAS